MQMTTEQQIDISGLIETLAALQTHEQAQQTLVAPRRVLGFRLGADLYGLDIGAIREIAKLAPLTFVPGAPGYVYGVFSLHGQIVPVVNLRRLLGVAGSDEPQSEGIHMLPRIVVLRQDGIQVGLLVDAVTQVHDVRVALEAAPLPLPGEPRQLREGRATVGEQVLTILDAPAIFARLLE